MAKVVRLGEQRVPPSEAFSATVKATQFWIGMLLGTVAVIVTSKATLTALAAPGWTVRLVTLTRPVPLAPAAAVKLAWGSLAPNQVKPVTWGGRSSVAEMVAGRLPVLRQVML